MTKRMALITLTVLMLFLPLESFSAETEVTGSALANNCKVFTLCSAQAANATCGGAGNERYVNLSTFTNVTAVASYAQTGGADGWTVKLYTAKRGSGYEATQRTLLNSLYDISVATTLTYKIPAPVGDVHAVVAGLSDDTVTLDIYACR